MNETARRPVPHINHTSELEAAAIAVSNAHDSEGKVVRLCGNPLDLGAVRQALQGVSQWFEDPTFYFHTESTSNAEIAAATNLILLATLLREHLKAGNV
jgi:hypothetical protein